MSTDLAAIPDFVSGAMEHWGLVTFREVNLLQQDAVSSTANKQRVAMVIGHELAHMWFGNLGKSRVHGYNRNNVFWNNLRPYQQAFKLTLQ
jgi:predicted metallopeptidase